MGVTVKERTDGPHSVRWYRLNAGVTANELASLARIARNTLRALERGGRSPSFDHEAERRVAEALGVASDAIAWGCADDAEHGEPIDLAARRVSRGLDRRDLASLTGVPLAVVGRAEAGSVIHPRYAKRLADFFGCRVTDFYRDGRETAA